MRMAIARLLGGIALMTAGCTPAPKEYPVALDQALDRLRHADAIGLRNARQCGLLIHIVDLLPVGNSVTWLVLSSNQQVARFTVSLNATATGTQVAIDVPKAEDGGEIYDGKQHYAHPALMQPLRPALQEMVDAAMEKRPFDWLRLPDPINVGPADSLTNCHMGQESLKRGFPVRLDDPVGVPHDVAMRLGLVH